MKKPQLHFRILFLGKNRAIVPSPSTHNFLNNLVTSIINIRLSKTRPYRYIHINLNDALVYDLVIRGNCVCVRRGIWQTEDMDRPHPIC